MVLQLKKFLVPPHPLTNFEIKDYYENDPRFNGAYSGDNLPKIIKNLIILFIIILHIINLDDYADVGTHCVALYVKNNEVFYFDSFSVEHVPEEIRQFNIVWILLYWIH